jgi:uncharacterized membrane protein YecN with MAPEG domain
MSLEVTPLVACLLAVLYVVLSARVINQRRMSKVSLGDGGDKALLKRLRVHGNFAEYVPFSLVLLLIAELQGAAAWMLYLSGLMLVAGRLCHAVGTGLTPQVPFLRTLGMGLTFGAIIATTVTIVRQILGG